MKLSEAIRLSPLVIKTIHGPVFKRTLTGKVCGACRIGGVAMAAGYKPARRLGRPEAWVTATDSRDVYRFIHQTWPWVEQSVWRRDGLWLQGVVTYIVYAHESAKLSAEEIAVAVETMEAKYDTQPATIDVAPNVAGDATQLMEVK